MLGISYDSWKATCGAYRRASLRRKEAYLQLYPFSRMSSQTWDMLTSLEFYEKYISNGSFVNFTNVMFHTAHYIQKDDGSFRNAELLSPILFLILQSLGKELADHTSDDRPFDISVYYAGNFEESSYFYKSEYDKFYKEINECIDDYHFYIKTDINSFFSSIDVNRLIEKLEEKLNAGTGIMSPVQINLIKEFLLYCGAGSFPLVESSVTSSFLATVIYLEKIDTDLNSFINTKIDCLEHVRLIRYVDDLYILLRCKGAYNYSDIHEASIEIRNAYSSLLKSEGLALNTKKFAFRESNKISDDLKKSLYDEKFNEEATNIESFFPDSLLRFLNGILERLSSDCIDLDQYNSLIQVHFSRDDIKFTPTEVYNYLVYGSDEIANSVEIADAIAQIAWKDVSVISLDSKRLLPLLVRVKSDRAIKKVLSRLFERYRNGLWNSNDITIAISYLLHSGFKHIDLLAVLKKEAHSLYQYYARYCSSTVLSHIGKKRSVLRSKVIECDWIANYLYFMYLSRKDRANSFEAFAFYKSFFDRITADTAWLISPNSDKRPNYEGYYKEKQLKSYYAIIPGSGEVLKKAHKLRNMNPINHSASGVIEKSERMSEMEDCSDSLEMILDHFLECNANVIESRT